MKSAVCHPNKSVYSNGLCRTCYDKKRRNEVPGVREAGRAATTAYINRIRKQVYQAYGDCCACCGETNPDYLELDHINNDGAAHRRALAGSQRAGCGWKFLTYLVEAGFPKSIQLLCANCHRAKSRGKVCKHPKETQ